MPTIFIGYAPALLPDELLYSWLARLVMLNAIGSPRECLSWLYGSHTFVPSIDLPNRLSTIQARLGDWLPYSSIDHMLEKGTLLPYHRPFLTPGRYESIYQTLLQGDGKGLKTQLGRVANRFGANPSLRWCHQCMVDCIKRYGSPYWARQHQLPGVTCCTTHRTVLSSLPPLSLRTDRQRFITPSVLNSASNSTADDIQLRFAQLSAELLHIGMPAIDAQQRARAYVHSALDKGFGIRGRRMDYRGLADEVRRSFQGFESFEHRERLLAPSSNPMGWIKDVMARPERSVHPICHILVIDFLFGSISGFSNACSSTNVLKDPATHSSKEKQSKPHASGVLIEHEATLRDVSLSCREVANLIRKSITTVVTMRRERGLSINERRQSLSDALLAKIRTELGSGSSPSSVASRCSVSLSTVYRQLAEHPKTRESLNAQILQKETVRRRNRWLDALATNPTLGATAARALAPADYAWLYRHDRQWLTSTVSKSRSARAIGPRLDWSVRDADLCQRLQGILIQLSQESPPKRISRSRLIRLLGKATISRNLHQLPRLQAILLEATESPEAFRLRLVAFAISSLTHEDKPIQLWRVKRVAGLRLWPDWLKKYASSEVKRINAKDTVCANGLC